MPLASGLFANRPTSGSAVGEPYIATDTKDTYTWDGSTWIKTGSGTAGGGGTLVETHIPMINLALPETI